MVDGHEVEPAVPAERIEETLRLRDAREERPRVAVGKEAFSQAGQHRDDAVRCQRRRRRRARPAVGDHEIEPAVPGDVCQHGGNGAHPSGMEPRPRRGKPLPVGGFTAQQHRNVVGALVCHQQIGDAVAVEVRDRHRDGIVAHCGPQRCGELGKSVDHLPGGTVDQHLVAAAVDDDDVGVAPGPQASAARAAEGARAPPAGVRSGFLGPSRELDEDAIGGGVGENEACWTSPWRSTTPKLMLLACLLDRPEAPLAVANKRSTSPKVLPTSRSRNPVSGSTTVDSPVAAALTAMVAVCRKRPRPSLL